MRESHAEFKHVSREVFNAVSDRIRADKETNIPITVYYNGTNLYGDVTIEATAGNSKAYKKALTIFNEEYCK